MHVRQRLKVSGSRRFSASLSAWTFAFLAAIAPARAQFQVSKPPPYTEPIARQKIKELLGKIDPASRQQTIDTLSGLLVWYRDIVDDELIAAWQRGDGRPDLAALMKPLADARLAASVIEFSWRQQRPATFTIAFAPMFVDLMARSPDSANPFMDDLNSNPSPALSQPETDAVCRILLDLPDIRTWRKSALRILPRYRSTTEFLLSQDLRGDNQEKRNLAQVWLNDLRFDGPAPTSQTRRTMQRSPQPAPATRTDGNPGGGPMWPPPGAVDASSTRNTTGVVPPREALAAARVPSEPPPYDGPRSGTFECTGGPIAQNAEYVFRNVPLVKMQLEYDTKTWDARLSPADGQTQRLILKNKSSGPQKRCIVHWTVIP